MAIKLSIPTRGLLLWQEPFAVLVVKLSKLSVKVWYALMIWRITRLISQS